MVRGMTIGGNLLVQSVDYPKKPMPIEPKSMSMP